MQLGGGLGGRQRGLGGRLQKGLQRGFKRGLVIMLRSGPGLVQFIAQIIFLELDSTIGRLFLNGALE